MSKKGLITLLMVFVMALGLVGCSDDDDKSAFEQLQEMVTRYQGDVTDAQNVLNSTDADYDALVAAIETAETTVSEMETKYETFVAEGKITEEEVAELAPSKEEADAALEGVKVAKDSIDNVVTAIEALPTPGALTLEDADDVEAARAAYGALGSEGEKAKVSNLATLEAAEAALGNAQDIEAIDEIAEVTIEAGEDVSEALPIAVDVTYGDGSTDNLAITWDVDGFDNMTEDTTTVSGIVINPYTAAEVALMAEVTVTGDVTAPVITLEGDNPAYLTIGAVYVEAGATATDNVDETITVGTPAGIDAIDTTTDGSFTLTYSAIDTAGNEAIATRTVIVDGTAPVISLVGAETVTITVGDTYEDAGITADEEIKETNKVGEVDENTVGTYTITYTAIDMAGNESDPVTRTVIVENVAGDLVSLDFTNNGELSFFGKQVYNYELTFTVDASVTSLKAYAGTEAGATATDLNADNNFTTESFNVHVADTQAVTVVAYDAEENELATTTFTLQ